MSHHELEIQRNPYTLGYEGVCECSDPDWTGDGWEGQVQFLGDTKQEVLNYYLDHLLEEKEAELV